MKPLQPDSSDLSVQVDLDTRFIGVNEREDAAALITDAGSFATAAINARFRTGKPETRGGYIRPGALNGAGWTGTNNSNGNAGAGLYVDRAGREWILQRRVDIEAGGSQLHAVRMGQQPVALYIAGADTTTTEPARATFTQAGDEMILWQAETEPLHWSGSFADTWQYSSEAAASGYVSYLRPLPSASFGLYAADRVVFPYRNGIGWTGIGEPRRWDEALNWAGIGESGPVTGLMLWRQQALVVFKERSVWLLNNWRGDLTEVQQERITDAAGCVASQTVTAVGGDIIWLGAGAVYRLTEVLQDSRQLSRLPVSWPIPKSMDRINWAAAAGACACLVNGLWYLAVPVDGSARNNAIFVFDTVTETWQGEDVLEAWTDEAAGPGYAITALLRSKVFDTESLIAVSAQYCYAAEHGWHDGYGTGDIRTEIETRGYALEDAGLKTLQRVEVRTEELGTITDLRAATDGIRGVQTVQSAQTRNRTRWLAFGKPARTMSNANDDAAADGREDYAWVVSDNSALKSGIPLGYLQTHKLAGMVRGAAVWVKLLIRSTRGRLRVLSVRAAGTKRKDWARRQ